MDNVRICGFVSVVLLLGGVVAYGQEDLAALPTEGSGARKMLHSYVLGEAQKQFDARREVVAGLKTLEDIHHRRDALRQKFLESLGGFPEKTPLNGRVVGTIKREGFRIERVIYESRPDHHVTGLFYVPGGAGPFPAILMPCGHSRNGKADESLQRACMLYAGNGFAVLCYDPIGQAERRQLIDALGKPLITSMTTEHSVIGAAAMLLGQNTATFRIWDGIRSLDYLCGRPEVDAKRIGCTGSSGGGMMTSYLMALDDRVLVGAPSCYITSLERLFATIGPQDAEQNITGQVGFGMEQSDYLTMHAPRPTLICAVTQDFFDIQGTWTSFREAKRVYGVAGFPERMDLVEFEGKHGYPKPQREAIVRWMRRWMMGKDEPVVEEDAAIFKDAELQCTTSGQVLIDFKGKSVVDFNIQRDRELAAGRAELRKKLGGEAWLKEVRRTIALPEKVAAAKMTEAGKIARDGYEIRKQVYETESGIQVPGLLFVPKELRADAPLVFYLHGEGKGADAAAGAAIEKLVKEGAQVLALDPRGVGETAPGRLSAKGPNYLSPDWNEAYVSIHLSRPLLGQRVYDVLSVLAATAGERDVRIVGVGSMGPVALHAAALEGRFKRVTLERSLASWSVVARSGVTQNQLTNVMPGALKVYDLPELAESIAPRKVVIRSSVDGNGESK